MDSLNPCGGLDLAALPDEVKEQLAVLDNSQQLLLPIFLGLALQYKAIDVQRIQLLAGATEPGVCSAEGCPDPTNMQLTSSLLILSSLLGFQKQSKRLSCEAQAAGECPDTLDPTLSSIIILIAVIRFFRLLETKNRASNGDGLLSEEQLEQEEPLF